MRVRLFPLLPEPHASGPVMITNRNDASRRFLAYLYCSNGFYSENAELPVVMELVPIWAVVPADCVPGGRST